jgi:hypothetical protein
VLPPDPDQLAQKPPPADEDQRRAEVDGQELQPRAGGVAHRAVEGPGGAVDRQRKCVDQRRAQPAKLPLPSPAFDQEGHREKEDHIGKAGQDQKVEGHRLSLPLPRPRRPKGRGRRRRRPARGSPRR